MEEFGTDLAPEVTRSAEKAAAMGKKKRPNKQKLAKGTVRDETLARLTTSREERKTKHAPKKRSGRK